MRVQRMTESGSGEPEATPSENGYAAPAAPALLAKPRPLALAAASRAASSRKLRRVFNY
jgi:hypothetical protein